MYHVNILLYQNYTFVWSYNRNKQNVHVHGSVGKLSDGVKIKNRNHTYVLGLFSWSLTKILVDFSHVLITHLNKAGYYLISSCIKHLVVQERNKNKDQIIISNDKYYCHKKM